MVCFWPSDEELTLEMSAHQTSQAENIPFQPLLIKPTSYSPKQYKQCFQSLAFQWNRHRLSSLYQQELEETISQTMYSGLNVVSQSALIH